MSEVKFTPTPAAIAVDLIVDDLTNRKGLRHEWDNIDEDIIVEIKTAWIGAVQSAYASRQGEFDDMLAALEQAKRLTDNINEFGACTDSELYDAAWSSIEAAIARARGDQS
jgi:hypothetical protein